MAANTAPIFSKLGSIQSVGWYINAAAATLYDGAGTVSTASSSTGPHKVFQADATNGGFVQQLRFKYGGTATTASNLTVAKIYVSTISTGSATDANTFLIGEVVLPVSTPSATVPMPDVVYPVNFALDPGYCLMVKNTVAQPASMGWYVTAMGGKY